MAEIAILVLSAPSLPRARKAVAVAALALLVLAVGVSLVGRDLHDPSDVLGALAVVVAVTGPVALAVDALADLAAAEPLPDGDATRRLPALR